MARSLTSVYRDKGTLTWGGTDLGYNSATKPAIRIQCSREVDEGFEEWHGQTPVHLWQMGWNIKIVVYLSQHDANTVATAFPGLNTTTSFTINDQTVAPGVDLFNTAGQYGQLVFTGSKLKFTAYKCTPVVLADSMNVSVYEDYEYGLAFHCTVDATNNILKGEKV